MGKAQDDWNMRPHNTTLPLFGRRLAGRRFTERAQLHAIRQAGAASMSARDLDVRYDWPAEQVVDAEDRL